MEHQQRTQFLSDDGKHDRREAIGHIIAERLLWESSLHSCRHHKVVVAAKASESASDGICVCLPGRVAQHAAR